MDETKNKSRNNMFPLMITTIVKVLERAWTVHIIHAFDGEEELSKPHIYVSIYIIKCSGKQNPHMTYELPFIISKDLLHAHGTTTLNSRYKDKST